MSQNADITNRVVSLAEDIEDRDGSEVVEFVDDALEVKVSASLDGTYRSCSVVVGTGGPHLEVHDDGTVSGAWGSDRHRTHYNNREFQERLTEYVAEMWGQAETEA